MFFAVMLPITILLAIAAGEQGGAVSPGKKPGPEKEAKQDEIYVPRDLDDCLAELKRLLPKEAVEDMKKGPEEDMIDYHFGLGTWIRNNWGLWKGSRLSRWFNDKDIYRPDDMSGIILDSFWRHLNGKPIRLEQQIRQYHDSSVGTPVKTGVRRITLEGKQHEIPWWRTWADYNFIETADFWKKVRSLPWTKTAYVGNYHEMTWCEWLEDGSRDQVAAWGVDFLICPVDDRFRVKPGPGKVGVRRWLFEEQQHGENRTFKDGRYYVFCLEREPVEQWRSVGNTPMCDLDTELEHVIGIIEVAPTFELDQRASSPVLQITRESLLSFRHERHHVYPKPGYEQQFAVVRAEDGALRFEAKGLPSAPARPEVVQKLLYAINTCKWKKQSEPHVPEISPPVMRTVLIYRDKQGQSRKVTTSYDMGGWYMDHFDSGHYSSSYPHLLFEVEANVRAVCAAGT